MSKTLHKILVKKIIKETPDTIAVQFLIPPDLSNEFNYKQGQYLSMQFVINGNTYRREYSLCSSPYYDEPLTIASKRVGNGTVSNFLFEKLKEGDVIQSYPPQGKFYTELNRNNKKTYFLVGGGSGITPLFSILKSVLLVEPNSRVILYYGNLNHSSIIFKKDLDNLSDIYKGRVDVYYTLEGHGEDWNGLSGRVNSETLTKIINDSDITLKESEFFICGPAQMMFKINEALEQIGVNKEAIHIEYFSPPKKDSDKTTDNEKEIYSDRKVNVILDDEETIVNVPAGTVILDSAIAAGMDPPYSCRSGICTTCRAKLLSGKVYMDVSEGLTDDEIKEGYILTCQSHPLTDDVSVRYE